MLKNIKNYAMALGALAIAATSGTLMSFENGKQTSNWYEVSGGNIISSSSIPAPSDDPNAECSTAKNSDMCAIQLVLNPSNPFPSTVAQAQANHTVLDEAYKRFEN